MKDTQRSTQNPALNVDLYLGYNNTWVGLTESG